MEVERMIATELSQSLAKGVYNALLDGLAGIRKHVLTPDFVRTCVEDAGIAPANIADFQRAYQSFLTKIEDSLRRQPPW